MSINYGYQPIVTNGLVLHLDAANPNSYRSGSTAWNDLSGNRNNGTLVSGSGYSSADFGSIVFNGVNNYTTVNSSSLLTFGASDFTFSWWQRSGPTQPAATIRSFGNIPNRAWSPNDWVIGQSSVTNFVFYVYNYSTSNPVFSTSVPSSLWQNIAITRQSNTWSLYVNASQPISSVLSSASLDGGSSRAFNIGTSGLTTIEWWSGSIALTQVYNRALSATEVLQNYNALKSRYGL